MSISPMISFGSADFKLQRYPVTRNGKVDEEIVKHNKTVEDEARKSFFARRAHVDVPNYKSTPLVEGKMGFRYHVEGDPADPLRNPIKKGHLRNLFKNLYYLDKAGIYHNDLDTGHVFFSGEDKVEIDCLRYSFDFETMPNKGFKGIGQDVRTPDFMMPSNEECFQYCNLGNYVYGLGPSIYRDAFVKDYLKEKSYYHQKRAELLVEQGFDPKSKTVRYEEVQSKIFENPSDDVVSYMGKRLELNRKRREAFTMWDEAGGACGHPVNPIKRFQSVILHLECLKGALDLREEAWYQGAKSEDKDVKEYFGYEEEYAKYWVNNLYNDTNGMGGWNFNDNKLQNGNDIFLGCLEDKKLFDELYSEINPTDGEYRENVSRINDVQEYYTNLMNDWSPRNNRLYRAEYYRSIGQGAYV